jgi:putative ABC transport system permease protein
MLAAVRERRREIGVLKAIGARSRDVLRVFVLEAAVLGVIGGVIGTALGILASRLVAVVVNGYLADQGLPGIQPLIPLEVLIGGVVGPTLVAILGGLVPAWRASQFSPREAVAA